MQTGVTGQPSKPTSSATAHKNAVANTLIWIGLLIVLTVGAGLVMLWYRRRLLGRMQDSDTGGMMEEFRRMRDSGEMSLEEYEATRRAMVARLAGNSPRAIPRPGPARPQGPDNTPTDKRSDAEG